MRSSFARSSRCSFAFALTALGLFAACGSSGGSTTTGDGADASTGPSDGGQAADAPPPAKDAGAQDANIPIGGDRPVGVHVPPTYVAGTPMPLVILLHGYSANSDAEESYLGLTAQSDAKGFLYVRPNGTKDAMGNLFWNGTDACCNFQPPIIDDSKYLSDLIDQVSAHYTVDPKRVYFIGHSNGGFMSYRMACEHGDKIAAIVSLAGAMWQDLSKCPAKTPVSVLEVHGTADATIPYTGGSNVGHAFPGATTTIADWTTYDGCASTADTSAPNLDLEVGVVGAETTVTKYTMGCKAGTATELWTITGGGHIPTFTHDFAPDAIDFLLAHPKP